ncbi:MAG: integrase arm-type DNA-binding domain-containing protein [Hyphomicrobiales bacterium]
MLTDTKIKNLKLQDGRKKFSDGGGLFIELMASGSKQWRLSYRFDGKQKTLYLGAYPTISLAEARKRRDQAKEQIAVGSDPSVEVKLKKAQRKFVADNTFGGIADEFIAKCILEGKADNTIKKKRWLLEHAKPLKNRPITEITAAEILTPLRAVEAKQNYETAIRIRGEIGQVFRYAIATARADNDPTFGLRGALVTPVVSHRAAITDRSQYKELINEVWNYNGSPETIAGLKLLACLYPRPGELRQASWSEFDLAAKVWILPKERTKMRREHKKPLSNLAMEVLKDLYQLTGHRELVFPSYQSPLRPMSENTLNMALRRIGYDKNEVTAHGFRASASSLLNESGLWSPDAIEAELAHVGADEVRRAYHRSLYWEERVKMTEWWSEQIRHMIKET